MYEFKIFEAQSYSLFSMNELLEEISQNGWEPIQFDTDRMQILARRPKTLND